jgi:hypothetical protein
MLRAAPHHLCRSSYPPLGLASRIPLFRPRILLQTRSISLPGPMSNTPELKRAFLSQSHFAVVGASKDQTKFGTKLLKWYQARELDVTPVHPVRS